MALPDALYEGLVAAGFYILGKAPKRPCRQDVDDEVGDLDPGAMAGLSRRAPGHILTATTDGDCTRERIEGC